MEWVQELRLCKKDRIAGFAKILCHDSVFFTLIFRLFEHFRNHYGISSAMITMLLIVLKNAHTHVCVCVFSLRQKLLTEIDKHLSACSFPCIPLHLIHRKISFLISTQLFLSCSQTKKKKKKGGGSVCVCVCVCVEVRKHIAISSICVSYSCKHFQMVKDPSTSRTAHSQMSLINHSLSLICIEIFFLKFQD